ncbi:MAG TPA: hypothetical protein VF815_45245 [Myxococcaceae bacterium]
MAQRRPTPRAAPRGKVAAKKAPAAKKATAIAKKVPAVAKKVLAAVKKAVPGKKQAAAKAPAAKAPAAKALVTKAPAAKRAAPAKKEALGPKSSSPRGEKLARAVSAAAGTAPGKGARGTKPPASPDTLEAKPSPMPPAAPRGEKLAEAVNAAAGQRSDTPEPPEKVPAEPATPAASTKGKRMKAVQALPPTEDALADASAPMGRAVVDPPSTTPPASEPAPAESASSTEPAPAPKRGKAAARRAEPEASTEQARPPAEPTRPAGPPAETQYLVLTGGSPFLRAIGYVQRTGGEPLPDFSNLTVAKMASPPLPTEPGTYEFRFRVRNGIGDFKLAQRNEKGTTKNVHSYEVDPKDAPQTWRFTIP